MKGGVYTTILPLSDSGRDEAETARRRGVLSKIDPKTNEIVSSVKLGLRPRRRRGRERPCAGRDRSL